MGSSSNSARLSDRFLSKIPNVEAMNETRHFLKQEERIKRTKRSATITAIYKKLKSAKIIIFVLYLGLTFFEKPFW
jgi:hypothetical protein